MTETEQSAILGRRRDSATYVVAAAGYATPCWLWQGYLNHHGYGLATLNGRQMLAHRAFYILARGEIPRGLQVDHLCRNRACVNPEHLEAVTASENLRRGLTGRHPKMSARRLTDQQVRDIRTSDESNRALAVRLGVSHETVRAARSGRYYREV